MTELLEALPRSWSGWWPLLVVTASGAAAGVINALAGGGGFIILPALIGSGLEAPTANGTFRIGIVAQNISALLTFRRRGISDFGASLKLLLPMALGALGGAWGATRLSAKQLEPVIGCAMLLWAVMLVLRPGRFSSPDSEPTPLRWWVYPAAGLIGGYGGLLQAGVGFPLVWLLVSRLHYPPVRANGIKLALILGYTLLALPLFISAGQVAWLPGATLAVGTVIGGWAGTRLQLRVGPQIVRWAVLVMVSITGVYLLVR